MGSIVRAQAWQGASTGLANLATTFANMIPIADKLIGQDQTKLALDEFAKLTQNITGPDGEKTDAATQLFSMMFGYNPDAGSDLDTNGINLMQDLLDLSKDSLLSKDTESFKAGLGVIKGELDAHVKKMQASKLPQTKELASVQAFGKGGIEAQRLKSQSFRALQEQQRQQEATQKQVSGISADVATRFPRADPKKLTSATETFSATLATEDFNKAIGEFVSATQKRKLDELKAGTARLRAENAKAARLLKPTASPAGKNVFETIGNEIKDLKSFVNQAPSRAKNIETSIANLAKSDVLKKNDQLQALITEKLQKLKTIPNDIKFAKQKINGLEKLQADANQELQTIGQKGGTPAQEFTERMQRIKAEVDEARLEIETALADSIAAAEELANLIDPEPTKEPGALEKFGGVLKRGVQAVTGLLPGETPSVQADTTGTPGFGGPQQQQTDFGSAGNTPEGSRATNQQGQTIQVVNGRWVLAQ